MLAMLAQMLARKPRNHACLKGVANTANITNINNRYVYIEKKRGNYYSVFFYYIRLLSKIMLAMLANPQNADGARLFMLAMMLAVC